MPFSHVSRGTRGITILLTVLTLSLILGALGATASADEPTTPAPGQTPSQTPDQTPAPDPGEGTTDDPGTGQPTGQPTTGEAAAAQPAPRAVGDSVVIAAGSTVDLNVLANDVCFPGGAACQRAHLSAMTNTVPKGWTISQYADGRLRVTVPRKITGRFGFTYTIRDKQPTPRAATATVSVLVVPRPAAFYNPPAGTLFSHPFRKGHRNLIRKQIIKTIKSVPYGGQIRIASWSFSSKKYRKALNQARKRGVSVQIVLAGRNNKYNSDWGKLKKAFGTNRKASSWVKRCKKSCRGVKGTQHSKMFLFSQAYQTRWVTMTGSANLTDFAVTGQWNQMTTMVNDATVYNQALGIWNEMARDRKASPMYRVYNTPDNVMYYYPRGGVDPKNDFMMETLNKIKCTGGVGGRTKVRIVNYAWYEDRGRWLARKVRSMWNAGCDISIVYGIMGNAIKNFLYSPKGRGRIPMRQILLANRSGDPIYYVHDKWIAVKGYFGKDRNAAFAMQGSFNFSNLGLYSDETFQRLWGRAQYKLYNKDFKLLWKDRQSRAPSPTSTISNVERTAPGEPRLGQGTYAYMSND